MFFKSPIFYLVVEIIVDIKILQRDFFIFLLGRFLGVSGPIWSKNEKKNPFTKIKIVYIGLL